LRAVLNRVRDAEILRLVVVVTGGEQVIERGGLSKVAAAQVGRRFGVSERVVYRVLEKRRAEERTVALACRHHWVIDPPNGVASAGECKHCGEGRLFFNADAHLRKVGLKVQQCSVCRQVMPRSQEYFGVETAAGGFKNLTDRCRACDNLAALERPRTRSRQQLQGVA
jgi:hypothetical protein